MKFPPPSNIAQLPESQPRMYSASDQLPRQDPRGVCWTRQAAGGDERIISEEGEIQKVMVVLVDLLYMIAVWMVAHAPAWAGWHLLL